MLCLFISVIFRNDLLLIIYKDLYIENIDCFNNRGHVVIMSQFKDTLYKLFEPMMKIEFYQNLLVNLLIILAYILMGMIVIAISRKLVTKFFNVNEKKRTVIKLREVKHYPH